MYALSMATRLSAAGYHLTVEVIILGGGDAGVVEVPAAELVCRGGDEDLLITSGESYCERAT